MMPVALARVLVAAPSAEMVPAATFAWLVLLAAGGVAAGTAVLRPVTAAPSPAGRNLARASAAVAVLASLMLADIYPGPANVLAPVTVACAVACALALLVLAVRESVLAGGLAAGLLALLAGLVHNGPARYMVAAGTLAATMWLGAIGAVATMPAGQRRALTRWLTRRRVSLAVGLAALAGLVVTAATALTTVVAGPVPAPGQPLLTTVVAADEQVPVLVVPNRPGWNLVHIGASSAAAGVDQRQLAIAGQRPGAGHTWVTVHLPAGPSRIWVSIAGAMTAVPVDTGPPGLEVDLRGPDGPECASAALGALVADVAQPVRTCPADQLTPADAAALRATVRFIAGRGYHSLTLVADGSTRGVAAAAQVRSAALENHLAVTTAAGTTSEGTPSAGALSVGTGPEPGNGPSPMVIVSGWAAADAALRDVVTSKVPAQGTYLASWLLTAPLLAHPAGQLIPLRYAPTDTLPVRYLTQLTDRFPGEPASDAGYTAWLAARTGPSASQDAADATVELYAASTFALPGVHSGGHHGSGTSWLPGGAIVAVSTSLDGR